MLRVHLPLLPLPVLAVVVAFSACSRPPSAEPAVHVIPPAAPYAAAVAAPAPAAPEGSKATVAAAPADAAPSAEDIKEFERPVLK